MDFSLYDQELDTSFMVGAILQANGWTGGHSRSRPDFAMARGFWRRTLGPNPRAASSRKGGLSLPDFVRAA
ncbi:hypothetical protein [Bradyrhizobium yuanmingense]|uniref:hypothetical protein n=1 Tax=Bradyrhizobium yuanmingense TaxID=108015 RepID=UPI003F6B61C3